MNNPTNKRNARRALFLFLLLSGLTVSAGTFATVFATTPYRINTGTIGALPGIGAQDARRTIRNAAAHWAAYGGSSRLIEDVGTTSLTACDAFTNVVSGNLGCSATFGCIAVAEFSPCGATWMIEVFGAGGTNFFAVGPQVGPTENASLFGIMVHEFGHQLLFGPGDGTGHTTTTFTSDQCIMGPTGSSRPGLCEREINQIGAGWPLNEFGHTGPGFLSSTIKKATSAGFPTPSSWSAWANTSAPTGIGGVEPIRGETSGGVQVDRVAFVRTDVMPHVIATCVPSNCAATTVSFSSPLYDTVRRPSVAYDPVRKRWFMFVVSTSQTVATNSNRVRIATSVDGAGWFDIGQIPNIVTAYPVSATYDTFSDHFIVAWKNSDSAIAAFPSTSVGGSKCNTVTFPGTSVATGCEDEVLLSSIRADTGALTSHFRLASSDPTMWGFTGFGSPTIYCDPGGAFFQCEVLIVSKSNSGNEIVGRRASVSSNGTFAGALVQDFPTGMTSNYAPSVSQRRSNGSGAIVLTAIGFDHLAYYRSKTSIGANWNPFATIQSQQVCSSATIELPSPSSSYESYACTP